MPTFDNIDGPVSQADAVTEENLKFKEDYSLSLYDTDIDYVSQELAPESNMEVSESSDIDSKIEFITQNINF